MTSTHGRNLHTAITIALLTVLLTLGAAELSATSNLSGRLIWTYQDSKTRTDEQQVFVQQYEAILRDRLLEKNDLRLSFFVNTSKNFTSDLTLLRYRGELGLANNYYRFDAIFSPRQEINALESPIDQEVTEQRYSLDVFVPNTPRVRVYYSQRARYFQGVFDGRIRDLRGDINYRWKVFEFGLNRWNAKSTNTVESNNTVSGGRFRFVQSFSPMLNVQAGYDGQLTERTRSVGLADQKTTNHTFNALVSSFYRQIYSSTFSFMSRHLTTTQLTEIKNRSDVATFQFKFLPTSPLRVDVLWNYLLTQQNGTRNLSDFASLQAVLTGPRRARWHGLVQVTQRFLLQQQGNGVIPPNLYFLTLRGNVYRGINARAEVSVAQKHPDTPSAAATYQNTSLLDLFMKPRPSWLVNFSVRAIKFSDRLYFLQNNRFEYILSTNYFARQYLNIGLDLRRTDVTTGTMQKNTSAVMTAQLQMRDRSTFMFSYGVNEIEFENQDGVASAIPLSRANNMNVQFQLWVTRRGAFSLNYADVRRLDGNDTSYLALNYRQVF